MMRRFIGLALLVAVLTLPGTVGAQDCYQCMLDYFSGCWECWCMSFGGTWCTVNSCDYCSQGPDCGGPGGGCFLEDVTVITPKGRVPIAGIARGDTIISRITKQESRFSIVTDTHVSEAASYLVVNGELGVTDDHPFSIGGVWVEARDLRVGDHLEGEAGEEITVFSIERVHRGVRVYNISVDRDHTFYAGSLLVHNKSYLGS